MAQTFVNLLVKDNGFNATLKKAMSTFSSLGNAANGAKGQFSKFADSISQVAQSQQMLNTALKGNPYGMLMQAATMAFTKIIEKATEATEAEKRAFEWFQQKSEREQAANEAIGRSTGELMAKYELLRAEWNSLSNDHQRNEWIHNNASAFKGLNLAVTDVTSAENVFVNNTSQVVAALKARAEAEAYADMFKDQIKTNAKKKANGEYNAQLITDPYYRPSEIEAQAAGFTLKNKHENFEYKWVENADPRNPGRHKEWTGRLSQLGLQRLNANRQLGATSLENADRMLAEQWAAKMAAAQANANALQNNSLFGSVGGSGGKGGRTGKTPEEIIAELNAKFQQEWESAFMKSQANSESLKAVEPAGPSEAWSMVAQSMAKDFEDPISPLQQLNAELAELKQNLENAPDTSSYKLGLQAIADKEKEIKKFKGETDTTEIAKGTANSWKDAASAMASVGAALQNMEDPGAKTAGIVMQAIANIASGFAAATAKDGATGNVWYWIAATAAGVANMTALISTIHAQTGYAQGGMVQGNSYSGDNIGGLVDGSQFVGLNAGEVVLNASQQSILANNLRSGGLGNLRLEAVVDGEKIHLVHNRFLKRTGEGEIVTWGN